MTRNRSAQPSVRTPASPLCRSMMRPKVFHGTNSITCANSVLPTFMRHSRSSNPESIAKQPQAIQIVDTLKSLQTTHDNELDGEMANLNRTAVIYSIPQFQSTSASRLQSGNSLRKFHVPV